jgi:RND family efflux transporter MFP subunit
MKTATTIGTRAGALAFVLVWAGCARPEPSPSEVARPVKTTVVTVGDESHTRIFPGNVEAAKRVELAFQVPGLLVKLPVKEGQKVGQGEVIGQLRPDEFQAQLKTLQGQLDQARASLLAVRSGERLEERQRREAAVRTALARLANARAQYERLAEVVQSGAVPRADFESAETAYHVAQEDYNAAVQMVEKSTTGRDEDIDAQEAQVRALEARVVEANLQLEDATLRAPYDGVIARRLVEENQSVRAKEPVVNFQDAEEIEVLVDVPETVMAADLRTADIVRLVAEFSAAPGLQFPAHIKEIAQQADPTTQTFQVRVGLEAPSGVRILPGMTGTVTATYRRASILGNPILVPVAAVSHDAAAEQVVWVLGPEGTVTRRPVKLGAATGDRVQVTDGLQPGDRIAVAGVSFLHDGMRVRDLGDALGGGQP